MLCVKTEVRNSSRYLILDSRSRCMFCTPPSQLYAFRLNMIYCKAVQKLFMVVAKPTSTEIPKLLHLLKKALILETASNVL